MSVELKIKSKHLAEEAKIIRFEEHKYRKQEASNRAYHYSTGMNGEYEWHEDIAARTWRNIRHHRVWDVRNEQRATFLARAYLAGQSYASIEANRKPENEYTFQNFVVPRVVAMVAKYGKPFIHKETWEGNFPNRERVTNPAYLKLSEDIKEWTSS